MKCTIVVLHVFTTAYRYQLGHNSMQTQLMRATKIHTVTPTIICVSRSKGQKSTMNWECRHRDPICGLRCGHHELLVRMTTTISKLYTQYGRSHHCPSHDTPLTSTHAWSPRSPLSSTCHSFSGVATWFQPLIGWLSFPHSIRVDA